MNAITQSQFYDLRINRLRDAIHTSKNSLCLERAELLLSFRYSKAGFKARKVHPMVKRAQTIAHIMAHRRPIIHADELIAGSMTSKRVAANFYPEGGTSSLFEDLWRLEKRPVPLFLTFAEKLRFMKIVSLTMRDSISSRAFFKPSRIKHLFTNVFNAKRYIVTEVAGVSHQAGDYALIIEHGLEASYTQAQQCLQQNTTPEGGALDENQRAFYESVSIVTQAIRKMASNLADEATCQAAQLDSGNPRKVELLQMAQNLYQVPWRAARTYHEGLQSAWLMHVALCLEDYEQSLSFGRIDQMLIKLYQQDLAAGRITHELAVEMTASFQLKSCEIIPAYSHRMDQYFSGNDVQYGITLGGVDRQGNDVTNEVSAIFLDAYAQIGTREPALQVRIHDETPQWFFEKCIDTLQTTGARPAFFGDASIIRALENAGCSTEDARNYALVGCTEPVCQGNTYNSADAALFNMPLCLELALNQGKNFDGKLMGVQSPALTSLNSMDEVLTAYHMQLNAAVDEMNKVMGWIEEASKKFRTTPVISLMTGGCMQTGKDVTWGGAHYDFTGVQGVGLADVGDSLYALNRLVFEEKRYTLEQFVTILKNNFKGNELLRIELLQRFPRYGNGDASVDAWAQVASDAWVNAVAKQNNTRGGRWIAGFYSMTCGYAFGRHTSALPNGRLKGERISNGCSPVDGKDKTGPSALFRSVSGIDRSDWSNSCVLNATFDKKLASGAHGKGILIQLLRHYFKEQEGMQVQVALLDSNVLKEAREDPNAHPNLLVRVSGYCAYFADLQPEVQDEIIARTMH